MFNFTYVHFLENMFLIYIGMLHRITLLILLIYHIYSQYL